MTSAAGSPREGKGNAALRHAFPKSAPQVGHEAAPLAQAPAPGPTAAWGRGAAAFGAGPGAACADRGDSPGVVAGWCCSVCCPSQKGRHSPGRGPSLRRYEGQDGDGDGSGKMKKVGNRDVVSDLPNHPSDLSKRIGFRCHV